MRVSHIIAAVGFLCDDASCDLRVVGRWVPLHTATGRPRFESVIGGKTAYMTAVYVDSTDNWLGMPTVNHVDIFGVMADGTKVQERIKK